MTYAARTAWNLSPNRLTLALDQRRSAGIPILDLTETNPTRCGLDYPEAEILAALSHRGSLTYEPHPRGAPEAREAVAADYRARGIDVSPDRLVLTASTSEAYAFLFRLLADPGDPVLVPSPCYPLFELLAQINDVRLVPYPLSPGEGFSIDLDRVAAIAATGARALLVVNPSSPTGLFLKRRELNALVEICAPRGIPLICDEVFGDYRFTKDPDRAVSLAGQAPLLTFTLNGLSKMLALPQLKLAWIAVSGPEDEASQALQRLEVIADTFLSVNTPVQRGLGELLSLRAVIQSQVMRQLSDNRVHLARRVKAPHPCRCLASDGGWYTVLEIPRTKPDEEWALELLQRDGVLTHPGYFFDFPDDGRLVISLLPRPDLFREGIDRMLQRLEAAGR